MTVRLLNNKVKRFKTVVSTVRYLAAFPLVWPFVPTNIIGNVNKFADDVTLFCRCSWRTPCGEAGTDMGDSEQR